MIFFEDFEHRLASWVLFRQELENHPDPLTHTVKFWNQAPISSRTCDPFDPTTWLKPWDLIEDNHYCEFSKILAIYYTLVLTDRFKNSYFEIQIVNDHEIQEIKYLLIVDECIIGYYYDRVITHDDLPHNLNIQESYPMLDNNFAS